MYFHRLCNSLQYISRSGCRAYCQPARMMRFNVKNVPDEERLQINYTYRFVSGHERDYSLLRKKDEPLSDALSRLSANMMKHLNSRKKKKIKREESDKAENEEVRELSVTVMHGDKVVDESVINGEAFIQDANVVIHHPDSSEIKYTVEINPPAVITLKLPECIMAGFSVFPNIDAEFVNLPECEFLWFVSNAVSNIETNKKQPEDAECSKAGNISEGSKEDPSSSKKPKLDLGRLNWKLVYAGHCYIPSNADIGCRLKVVCTPRCGPREGRNTEGISKVEITAGPGHCPYENRHLLTKELTEHGSFRVVSYNILADVYADSDFTRNYLFPYCPSYALAIDYRKQLLLKELMGYNADIICLQEVDYKVFLRDFSGAFDQAGFGGTLMTKAAKSEGTATFYRRNKFRFVSQKDIVLNESLQTDPTNKELWDKICSKEALKTLMVERSTALQVTVLESIEQPGKHIIVGTTHLYFHPKADHVRLIQALISLRHLHSVVQEFTELGKEKPSVIFCGDLNSNPISGTHDLIKEGRIEAKHADWYSGGIDEFAENMNFTQDIKLTSACGTPTYTNYVTSFQGCLDYIYIDADQLKTTRVIPLPSHEEVTRFTALPNPVFPSDHLALVCDLTWTCKNSEEMEISG